MTSISAVPKDCGRHSPDITAIHNDPNTANSNSSFATRFIVQSMAM